MLSRQEAKLILEWGPVEKSTLTRLSEIGEQNGVQELQVIHHLASYT